MVNVCHLCMQTQLKNEVQLRQELEERLANQSSLNDRSNKDVTATKVHCTVFNE